MILFISTHRALAESIQTGAPITSAAYEMSARPSQASSQRTATRLATVHAMITDSYPQELDFSVVAERVGMSEAGFSRFLRHTTEGPSPSTSKKYASP